MKTEAYRQAWKYACRRYKEERAKAQILGARSGIDFVRGSEVVFFHKNFRDPANYYVKMYSIDFFLKRL